MTSEEVARRRTARRLELLDAADEVVRRDGPRASMAAIAARAGTSKPILYRHFGDKGGLLTALAERYAWALMTELDEALGRDGDVRARLAAAVDTYLSFIESNPQVYRFLMHRAVGERPEVHAAVASFAERIAERIADTASELVPGVPLPLVQVWAHGVVGFVQSAGDWWMRHRMLDRRELVTGLVELIHGGIAAFVEEESTR